MSGVTTSRRSLDRATIGVVTAALIVGSSMLVAASASDSFAMRFFGTVGVAIAFVNSLWLLASMRRAHR